MTEYEPPIHHVSMQVSLPNGGRLIYVKPGGQISDNERRAFDKAAEDVRASLIQG